MLRLPGRGLGATPSKAPGHETTQQLLQCGKHDGSLGCEQQVCLWVSTTVPGAPALSSHGLGLFSMCEVSQSTRVSLQNGQPRVVIVTVNQTNSVEGCTGQGRHGGPHLQNPRVPCCRAERKLGRLCGLKTLEQTGVSPRAGCWLARRARAGDRCEVQLTGLQLQGETEPQTLIKSQRIFQNWI